jgi:hypothetical protein
VSHYHYIECNNCSAEITGRDMEGCDICNGDFCDLDCYLAHSEECKMRDLEKRGQMRLIEQP